MCHIGRRALRACEMSAVLKSGFSPLELLKAPRETQVEICDLAGGGQSLAGASSSHAVTSAIISPGGFLVAALVRTCARTEKLQR